MAHIYRLIFSLFLVFYSSASFALLPQNNLYTISGFGSNTDLQALCSAYSASKKGDRAVIVGSTCKYAASYSVGYTTQKTCPSNSSLTGNQCVCNAGYEEKNGQCELPPPPDPCEDLNAFCASQFMKETSWETSGKSRPASVCSTPKMQVVGGSGGFTSRFPGCSRGCSIETYPGIVSSQNPFDDSWKVSGDGKYNGQSCNADSSTATPEEPKPEEPKPEDKAPCKSGEFSTNVNGVDVCIPPKSKSNDGSKTTVNNSDGSTSEITKVTVCSNGSCNTTITKIDKDSSGSNTGTSTRTITETEDEFCQKNPANSLCKKDKGDGNSGGGSGGQTGGETGGEGEEEKGSSFGGSCSSGFTCEGGDGIACAIAKKQHEDSCALSEESEESVLYRDSKGKEGSVTGDLDSNETRSFSSINSSSRFGASSCVQDLTVTVMGESVTLEISKICPWLSNLGYVLVAVAWIIAATIVMRGRT